MHYVTPRARNKFAGEFVERIWKSVKYENIYLEEYRTVRELESWLGAYFQSYNHGRIH